MTISRRERRENSGEQQVVNLLEAKLEQARLSAADGLNARLLGSNSSYPLRPFGLQNFLTAAAVGSQTGTVGGINKATYTWWNNQYETASDAFAANGINAMRSVYNKASQGADHPDLVLTTRSTYENYEKILTPYERINKAAETRRGEAVGDVGFDYLMFKGAFMFYDDQCLADRMYFLNTRYMTIFVDTESDWQIQDWVTPNNQTASSTLMVWMGLFAFSNLARQGVVAGCDTY